MDSFAYRSMLHSTHIAIYLILFVPPMMEKKSSNHGKCDVSICFVLDSVCGVVPDGRGKSTRVRAGDFWWSE